MKSSVICLLVCLALLTGVVSDAEAAQDIPRGFYPRLEISHAGRTLMFGPFVGYYFKPISGADTSRLEFVCYNERQFYTDELPADTLLFKGEAVLTTLPEVKAIPASGQRITPIFASEAPDAWLKTRPEPQENFRHFHSTYNRNGATYTGYWLKHDAVESFTYNMGGRLSAESPLYHQARPENQADFPAIIEFDRGKR